MSTGSQSFVAKTIVDEIVSKKTKMDYEKLTSTIPLDSQFFKSFIDYAWEQIKSDSIDGKLPDEIVFSHFKKLECISNQNAFSIKEELEIYDLIDKISGDIINARIQKEKAQITDGQTHNKKQSKKSYLPKLEEGDYILIIVGIVLILLPNLPWYIIGGFIGIILVLRLL